MPALGIRAPKVNVAMWNLASRRILFQQFSDLHYRLVRQHVRRSIYAARHYAAMKRQIADYFKNHRRDTPKLASYFDALGEAEACLLNVHILADCLHALDPNLVSTDGHLRVKLLANSIKHFGGKSKGSSANAIVPIYFVNHGLSNGVHEISFSDLHAIVRENVSAAIAIISRKDP
ncbi:hypothetical protein [Tabrizicola sp.]|jgi:hypothetical protein|uniref:hypothetical protein n=1 Tax=Tabrizicola sp. TaxID=2005166 RepID=UPI0025D8102F|nr:hypothetical protein [Tabrizicola sp.]